MGKKWKINVLFKDIYDFSLRNCHINGITEYGVIFVELSHFHGINGAISSHCSALSKWALPQSFKIIVGSRNQVKTLKLSFFRLFYEKNAIKAFKVVQLCVFLLLILCYVDELGIHVRCSIRNCIIIYRFYILVARLF